MSTREKKERNYENVNKGSFPAAGEYNIPILTPVDTGTATGWDSIMLLPKRIGEEKESISF